MVSNCALHAFHIYIKASRSSSIHNPAKNDARSSSRPCVSLFSLRNNLSPSPSPRPFVRLSVRPYVCPFVCHCLFVCSPDRTTIRPPDRIPAFARILIRSVVRLQTCPSFSAPRPDHPKNVQLAHQGFSHKSYTAKDAKGI